MSMHNSKITTLSLELLVQELNLRVEQRFSVYFFLLGKSKYMMDLTFPKLSLISEISLARLKSDIKKPDYEQGLLRWSKAKILN